ncbi:hypothetical protein [Rhizobium sp. MHM7A]|uniref:hypothetical protein n=1 Tax=Rhizobium sp. MHM7A TaxID=2583233 RepID=UPI001105EEFF|nr:hypothetical protein [Rhizobium sp. MHM7A]TLX17109.1 hypothetical protein FFR93_07300 [Rhizobium sp. MHM7A]
MTKIAFPLQYTLMAVYQRFRSANPLFVTESVEFDVRDLDEGEAPVVASVATRWRLPIPGIDQSQPRAKSEEYAIRTFDDLFYVPVRKYTKNDLNKWFAITPESFPDLHLKKDFAVTPFEVPVKKASTYPSNPVIGSKTATAFDGSHSDYEAHKVKQVKNPEARAIALAEAEELINRFAFINGELWLATKSEPVIRCDRKYGGQVFIDIVEAGEIGPENDTYFRLNRLEDCRDFIKAAYPGVEVGTHIKNIKINEPDAFKFYDDASALKAMAEETQLKLAKFAPHDTENEALQLHFKRISEACDQLKDSFEHGDDVADLISNIAHDFSGNYQLNINAMKAVVERWNLRPVESAMGMRR